jgi:two-component system, CitB family, sensor kinase
VADRILIFNTRTISNRGVPIGSVTTLRDRTELLALERELDVTRHVTDTLRAQAHEFSNRLHTISGLIELGEYGEVVHYVQRLDAGVAQRNRAVTDRIADPAVAALLVAKQNQADERGVALVIAGSSSLDRVDDAMSTDIATVVGNLVDNAFDAVASLPGERRVLIEVIELAEEVRITVRDSGPGLAPELAHEVFRRGFTTKGDGSARGIGLSLVLHICHRRGGSIRARNEEGAVFEAHLPWRSGDPADADLDADLDADTGRDVELR